MVYEDFTTYTEVDYNDAITRIASKVTFVNMQTRNYDYYVWKDKGSGYFGDFEHKFVMRMTAGEHASCCHFWQLVNAVDDGANTTGIKLYSIWSSVYGQYIALCEGAGWGSENDDIWYAAVLGTIYYVTIKREGTSLTAVIRTESHEGPIQATLSITVATTTYQYIEVTASHNTGSGAGYKMSGYIENLSLKTVERFQEEGTDFRETKFGATWSFLPWSKRFPKLNPLRI